MGDHAEDEIHREMFGHYPWESEDYIDEALGMNDFKKHGNSIGNYLSEKGITNHKQVYRLFEQKVLGQLSGKNRKKFKMINNCNNHIDLFKKFIDMNIEVFKNKLKLNNINIPIEESK